MERSELARTVRLAVSFTLMVAASSEPLFAAVTLLSPENGARFENLTDWQQKAFSGANRQERFEILKGADKNATEKEWRRQRPLVFKWKATEGDTHPWRIRLATKSDFSDAQDLWVEKEDAKRMKSADAKEATWEYKVPRANLEPGRTYWWEVWSCVRCRNWPCGFTYPDKCACGATKHGNISGRFFFTVTDEPPRWIAIEGRVKNMRDIGGWTGECGRKVRMGMAYRGQAFNDNSVAGVGLGRNRLMIEDAKYLTETLGIKTELDLRSDREIAGMTASPLGSGVKFIHNSSGNYTDIFTDWGRKAMAMNFRVFCDRSNFPIYFHCIAGADRTGTLAFVLNGILGVGKEDLERDWESTFYPNIPGVENPEGWQSLARLDKGFAKYGEPDDTLQRRIELYLLDIGITPTEIETFKSIMLEEAKCPDGEDHSWHVKSYK